MLGHINNGKRQFIRRRPMLNFHSASIGVMDVRKSLHHGSGFPRDRLPTAARIGLDRRPVGERQTCALSVNWQRKYGWPSAVGVRCGQRSRDESMLYATGCRVMVAEVGDGIRDQAGLHHAKLGRQAALAAPAARAVSIAKCS